MADRHLSRIDGGCHCGNIRYTLLWPGSSADISVRVCSCTFCQKHGGAWTSKRDAEISATIKDLSLLSKYRFGTATADFYVCSQCGAVPFVISEIDSRLYAVVNVNTFEGVDRSAFTHSASDFEGEEPAGRLQRRARNWIPEVIISAGSNPSD